MTTASWTEGTPVSLETRRFYIRSIGISDVNEEYLSWWNDTRVQDTLNSPARGWSMADARKHVNKFNNVSAFHLGLFRKNPSELAGFVALFMNRQSDVATMNIVIGNKKYWGSKVPFEASRVIFPFAFEELKANKLKAEVNGNNRSSLRMVRDLGFVEEGVLRQDVKKFSGERLDKYIFGLLAADWRTTLGSE